MKIIRKLWIGIAVLAVLSPFGLLLPGYFKSQGAWGEWGADTLRALVGYMPEGLRKASSAWEAPLPDYALKGWEEKGAGHLSFAYMLSACIGIIVTALAVLLIGKLLTKNNK